MSAITRQNRDAKHENAVVFACDYGHLPYAMFAADRIRRTEPDGPFDIVICMPDIGDVRPEHMAGPTRLCQVDMSALPDVPMVKAWISNATYFRWVLPETFLGTYDSIFYLDTDTYLARPGVQRLFDGLSQPVALSAVIDFQQFVTVDEGAERAYKAKIRDIGGANGAYYNAGVFLSQPEAFMAMDGTKRFVEAAKKNVEYLPVHMDQDQGAMNLAFADDILPLNPLYNWRSYAWLHRREVERYDPYVLHFVGRGKPWNLQDHPFVQEYEPEYSAFLNREFPEHQPPPALRSAAWRYANPKHKWRFLEDIRVKLYLRRFRKKIAMHENRDMDTRFGLMDEAIASAAIG